MFYSSVSSFFSYFDPFERQSAISFLNEYQESDQIFIDLEEILSCNQLQPIFIYLILLKNRVLKIWNSFDVQIKNKILSNLLVLLNSKPHYSIMNQILFLLSFIICSEYSLSPFSFDFPSEIQPYFFIEFLKFLSSDFILKIISSEQVSEYQQQITSVILQGLQTSEPSKLYIQLLHQCFDSSCEFSSFCPFLNIIENNISNQELWEPLNSFFHSCLDVLRFDESDSVFYLSIVKFSITLSIYFCHANESELSSSLFSSSLSFTPV